MSCLSLLMVSDSFSIGNSQHQSVDTGPLRTKADKITDLTLADMTVQIDEAGYLLDPLQWSNEFANHVAVQEQIALTAAHWEILDFMRQSWEKTGVAIDARHVFNFLRDKHGVGKSSSKQVFFDLFPYGYVKQAVKMAGMKQPRAWSTG